MARFVISRISDSMSGSPRKRVISSGAPDYELRNVFESHATPTRSVPTAASRKAGKPMSVAPATGRNVAASTGTASSTPTPTRSRRGRVRAAESAIHEPETCAACRSRSATSPAATTRRSKPLEPIHAPRHIKLSFADGILFSRLKSWSIAGAAAALFSGP